MRSRVRVLKLVVVGLGVGLLVAGCADDPTSSSEYQDLESQLAAVQSQLDEVTAERDALAGQVGDTGAIPFDIEALEKLQQ